jgi:hypothetical protein
MNLRAQFIYYNIIIFSIISCTSKVSVYDEALYKFIDDSSTKTFISSFAGSNGRIFLFDTTVFNSPSGYLNYTYNFYYGFDGHYLSDTNFRHNYRQMLRNWDSISKSWKPQFLTVNNEFPLDSCDFILYSTGIYDDGLLIFEIYPLKPKREWYKVTHLDYRIIIGFTKAQIGLFFIKHGKIEKYRTTQYTID